MNPFIDVVLQNHGESCDLMIPCGKMAESGMEVFTTRTKIDSIPDSVAPMGANQSRPKVQFRVLIIGRANAGKTTILQRVCDTTKSPTIYRKNSDGERQQVRPGGLTTASPV